MLFWLVAAVANVSAPKPVNFLRWYKPDDMPAYHQIAGVTRKVYLRMTVRPDGSLQSCEVENDGGDAKLAAYSCALTLKRAKIEPATWSDGTPAFGVYRWAPTWAVGSPPPPDFALGDLELEVDRLPKGERSPAFVSIMFAVDTVGSPSLCSAAPPSSRYHRINPELVPIACEQWIRSFKAVPARDDAGNDVPSVQIGTVKFVRRKQPK
jgi:hypothetical protein